MTKYVVYWSHISFRKHLSLWLLFPLLMMPYNLIQLRWSNSREILNDIPQFRHDILNIQYNEPVTSFGIRNRTPDLALPWSSLCKSIDIPIFQLCWSNSLMETVKCELPIWCLRNWLRSQGLYWICLLEFVTNKNRTNCSSMPYFPANMATDGADGNVP